MSAGGTADEVDGFWRRAREATPGLPPTAPEAWAFGATPEQADELLALVLDGTKTATASSRWDYELAGEALPEAGELDVVLDGAGRPRAVLEIVAVGVVPFDEVDESHAFAEGEGDRSLASWREVHEGFWRRWSEHDPAFAPDMPVVCERFALRYAE